VQAARAAYGLKPLNRNQAKRELGRLDGAPVLAARIAVHRAFARWHRVDALWARRPDLQVSCKSSFRTLGGVVVHTLLLRGLMTVKLKYQS
jgi:hypothetical protein